MTNPNENTFKSSEQIQHEIKERKAQGKPTGRLERELLSRKNRQSQLSSSSGSAPSSSTHYSSSSTSGRINENEHKTTAQISREISERKAQGKPTGRLERELYSRQ